MPVVLQEKLIQWILLPLSRIAEKMPRTVRDAAVSLSIAAIIFMQFGNGSGLYQPRFLVWYITGYILFGIVIFCGLTPDIKPVQFSPVLMACWLVVGTFMLASSVLVAVGRLAHAIIILAVFPVIYLVWSGPGGFERLFRLAIRGVMLSFIFFTVVSVLFYPLNGIDYSSFITNRNGTGFYLTSVFVCLLCFIFTQDRYSFRVLVADMAIGFAAATIYYTNSRTAIYASAICLLATIILQFFTHKKNWCRVLLVQVLPVAAAVVLLVPSATYLYRGGYLLSSAVQTALAPTSPNTPDTPNTPSVSDVLNEMHEYMDNRVDDFYSERYKSENFNQLETNINNLTTGRFAIWKKYLEAIGFLGHPADSSFGTAHCTVLQFAFDNGALAGVCFLLVNILAGLSSIRFAFTRRDMRYNIAPFAITIAFGAISIVASIAEPLSYSPTLLYFLSLAPLFTTPSAEAEQRLPTEM